MGRGGAALQMTLTLAKARIGYDPRDSTTGFYTMTQPETVRIAPLLKRKSVLSSNPGPVPRTIRKVLTICKPCCGTLCEAAH
jgi:hypothetical protein